MDNDPNRRWSDLEPGELEIPKLLGIPTRGNPLCPPADLLRALQAEALPPETAQRMELHLAGCRFCQILMRDLPQAEGPLNRKEDERISERLLHSTQKRMHKRTWRFAFQIGSAVAVTAAIVAGVWVYSTRRNRQVQITTASRSTSEENTSVFVLDKPAVVIPMPLLTRGASSDDAYAKALTSALEPYRAGRYAEAVARLESLSAKYPQKSEAPFYLGIAQLFLGDNLSAEVTLERAEKLAQGAFVDECRWYLALADIRLGKTSEAASALQRACAEPGEFQERACTGLSQLLPLNGRGNLQR